MPGCAWPLFVSLALAWAVPQSSLLGLSFVPRFLVATALAFAPVFLANLVFAERFRRVGSSTIAFGTNLLGAMVGGVLEYSALVVGYRSLLVARRGPLPAGVRLRPAHERGGGERGAGFRPRRRTRWYRVTDTWWV